MLDPVDPCMGDDHHGGSRDEAGTGAHGDRHGARDGHDGDGHGNAEGHGHGEAHGHGAGHGHAQSRGYADAGGHALPGGLAVASNGLRLVPSETRIEAGVDREWTFEVRDDDGDVVTEFAETHDRLAHLILVRRDLTNFRHLHPELDGDGTWTASFALRDPGAYRAFVDVLVDGEPTTLAVDLLASGDADYGPPPGSTREASAAGYDVSMSPRRVRAGEATTLEFAARRDGAAAALEPYLGALGHLVALRDGDLAYLHVHPEETAPDEGVVRFAARFPTAGRYRLFLQARPEGELVTAAFDVEAE